jgi:hypothetical protein
MRASREVVLPLEGSVISPSVSARLVASELRMTSRSKRISAAEVRLSTTRGDTASATRRDDTGAVDPRSLQ